jgi:hypothetical protein
LIPLRQTSIGTVAVSAGAVILIPFLTIKDPEHERAGFFVVLSIFFKD